MINGYILTILILMSVWSIVTLGLNVITGYAGQFNLGIGVYMGTGAYTSAMLTTEYGFSFWEALPVAICTAALMGLLTGLPALRVRDDSLAVLTIGLVFVFESLLVYIPYFGGPSGISRIPHPIVAGVPLHGLTYLALVATALVIVICFSWLLRRSWLGLALESVREDELATNVIGIYPPRFKLYAFTIGAAISGLGGVLYAHYMQYITPYDFGFMPSIYVLVMLVFGGVGTIRGAIFGAFVLTALPEVFRFAQNYRNLIDGAVLVVMMLYQPGGVLGKGGIVYDSSRRIARYLQPRWFKGAAYAQNP